MDWKRTSRFAILGLTLHGPWFFKGFQFIDRVCGPSKTLVTVRHPNHLHVASQQPMHIVKYHYQQVHISVILR